MKRQSVLVIVALVLAFAGTQATGYNVSEFPICTNDASQINPAINGSIIVWQDYRNGNWDIYGYDLSTQTEFPICTNDANQFSPDVSGDIVVWEDHRYDSTYKGFYCSIYGYKLSTRTEFLIYHMNSYQLDPAIDGNFVVWLEYYLPTSFYRINGYSLSGHTKFIIFDTSLYEHLLYYPVAVSGSIVVWMSNIGGSSYEQMRSYDFYNHTFLPTNGAIYGLYPKINGSVVVYEYHEWKVFDYEDRICYTDFSKQCLGPFGVLGPCSHCLTYSDPNPCYTNCRYVIGNRPDISGNIIVWDNSWWENGNDIYGYDISTRTRFLICENSGTPINPAIDGNIAIWQDYRNGNWDIYGARLEPFCLGKPEMDFNGDCKVDFADFALFAQSWIECNLEPKSACWE